jgi:hypothetical protein
MSTDLTPKQPRSLDEFSGWTDEVESHDEQVSERAIIGQLLRFSNDGKWLLPDQTEPTKLLLVANTKRVLTKWGKERKPVETTFLKAGEKIPDMKKRNEETPRSEWVNGPNNSGMKGPWEAQHIVYLVDPISIDQYSYPTSTIGGGIAVRELVGRILWMRRFRGNATYPVVELATRFMPTKHGGRQRPHFEIVDWTTFDLDDGGMISANDQRQLPPQQPAEKLPEAATDNAKKIKAVLRDIGAQTVNPPSAKEVTGDEIPW